MSRHRAARMTLLAVALMLAAVASRAPAATYSWTGQAGIPNWSAFTPSTNWTFVTQPPAFPPSDPTTQLVFNFSLGSLTPYQDLADPFVLNRITFGGVPFALGGQPIQFANDGVTPPAVLVNTPSPQVINNNLILANPTTINGAAGNGGITLGGKITGAGTLIVLVPTTLSGGSIAIAGGQNYQAPISLGAATTLSSSGPSLVNILFANTLDGPFALTTNASGNTTFAGAVGGSAPLASLTSNGPGTTFVAGPGITTTGAQTYINPVQVDGPSTTFTSTGGGNITFGNALNGTQSVATSTTGIVTFAGPVGSLSQPIFVTVSGRAVVAGGLVRTGADQNYGGPLGLVGDTSFFGQKLLFNSTVDGGGRIVCTATSGTTLRETVGGTNAPGSLIFPSGGPVTVYKNITTMGGQLYGRPFTLAGNATLTNGSDQIIWESSVDGPFDLTVNNGGLTTFKAPVGSSTPLTGLTTGAGGTTQINGGLVLTSGGQTYNNPVTLGAGTTSLASSGGGNITFGNALNGGDLTVATAGITTFAGPVGGTTPPAQLRTDGAGTTRLGNNVTTTGAQQYFDPVTLLGGNIALTTGASGQIVFVSTVDGPGGLTVSGPNIVQFGGGPIGGTAPLASLSTVSTHLTAGAITVAGAVDIQASSSLSTGPVVSTTSSVFVAGTTISVPSITAANGVGVFVHGTGTVGVVAGPGGFNKNGGGSVTLTGVNTYTGPTVVQAGTLHVSGSIEASSGVSVNNFQVFVADTPQSVRLLTLTPGSTGTVGGSALKVGDGTSAAPLTIISFPSLPPPFPQDKTVLQLQGHGLIVDYSPGNEAAALSQIRSYIFQGYQTGNGILDNTGKPIGYAQASEALGAGGGSFLGLTADGTSVLVRPTLAGDATLDGKVDFNDLVKLAQNYNTTVSATTESWWFNGDFTNNGVVDFNDLVLLAQNYNTALAAGVVPGAPAGFEADLSAALASIPEPQIVGVAWAPAVVGFRLLTRRARHNNRRT